MRNHCPAAVYTVTRDPAERGIRMGQRTTALTREDAERRLRQYGIDGPEVYLVDIVPLIEMMWADGSIQKAELSLFEKYLEKHVASVNERAGREVLTKYEAFKFASRFFESRPDPGLLRELRALVGACSGHTAAHRKAVKSSLLAACLEIAQSSSSPHPYPDGTAFDPEERACFFAILDSFGSSPHSDR